MMSDKKGLLYVVSTPIGNLGDITLRAIEALREVDLVIAENRERALKLLSYLEIRKPIITINAYNEGRKAKTIVEELLIGKSAALISGAGAPCISDPGNMVVRTAYDMGVQVTAIPGPSAVISALSVSGLWPDRFVFYGFLPQKRGKRRKVLAELLSRPLSLVFFESPRRLAETLNDIAETAPDREVALLKEMTKVHEELTRGLAKELCDALPADVKGEYTIVVAGEHRKGTGTGKGLNKG
jgi:16S rRNA (cytidine1402-2'-O)-methyltransferase